MSQDTLKYQKIIKVGNSLAITLDKEFVSLLGINSGDQIVMSYHPKTKVVSFAPVKDSDGSILAGRLVQKSETKIKLASTITPELHAWIDSMLEDDKVFLNAVASL